MLLWLSGVDHGGGLESVLRGGEVDLCVPLWVPLCQGVGSKGEAAPRCHECPIH